MKFCDKHWKDLREAIDSRGLGHLISKDGAVAAEAMTRAVQGVADKTDFDPLLDAYFAISAKIIEIRGLMYMAPDAPCPMCEDDECNPNWAENWIQGASNDALEKARAMNLVPKI